jgi:hypothetical protein
MIHHVSIDADDPMAAATVLAKLMGGSARGGFSVVAPQDQAPAPATVSPTPLQGARM